MMVFYHNFDFGFLEDPSSLVSFIFALPPSALEACASSILMYFAALAKMPSNLGAGFLAIDLKKSQSDNPYEKALAKEF
ncbi:UNVERIFIED_CONTAM: hypothetical protein Sradi_3671800 [Sesamum radiatum]|uniref:Uncharacterized protein n=1 Tax=Sesamum radiatum TaxID=300843 RepID=A0AAW2QK81_SESRA